MIKKITRFLLISAAITAAFAVTAFVTEPLEAAASNVTAPLTISVSYTTPGCASPMTFTVNASGGSGNYKYLLNGIDDVNAGYAITDPTKYNYQSLNKYDFTFYASGTYRLRFYVMDTVSNETKRTSITININDSAYPSIDTIANNVASKCLADCQAAGKTTEYDKALWLHDWIVENCKYDYSLLYCGEEGPLARKTATCEGYHRAYSLLLSKVGIQSKRMTGNGHCWTAVKMDGNWYQVDVTWDDPGNEKYNNVDLKHLYFGLTDDVMRLVHSEHTISSDALSNSFDDNYYIKTGLIKQWSDPLIDRIQSNLDSGRKSFDIPITGVYYSNVLYSLAAYQLEGYCWHQSGKQAVVLFNYIARDGLNGSLRCEVRSLTDPIIKNVKQANCTSSGYTGDKYCKGCGKKIESGKQIKPFGHDHTQKIVNANYLRTAATSSSAATYYYACKRCGAKGSSYYSYGQKLTTGASVTYTTHVQRIGWQDYVKDGIMAGTTGKSLRLEGIKIKLANLKNVKGGIEYRTHIQKIGWEKTWRANGQMSGTSGRSLRLEAIQIRLTGEMAQKYDVYYRVHAQKIGWMGWAKNGQSAGTAGFSYRLEGIQIKLVKKGSPAPGSTKNCFRKK